MFTLWLCSPIFAVARLFCSFANANVLLVLGEMMGHGDEENEGQSRKAIPLVAGNFKWFLRTRIPLQIVFDWLGLFLIFLFTHQYFTHFVGAIVIAQATMAVATYVGDKLTISGVGRKPLFLAALASLPVRCALIIYLRHAGDSWLLSTQILDGVGGGLMGLVQPYLVADITFGTGRFNVLSKCSVVQCRFASLHRENTCLFLSSHTLLDVCCTQWA